VVMRDLSVDDTWNFAITILPPQEETGERD